MLADGGARLVLWDIDNTVLTIGPVSRELYAAAFLQITGEPMTKWTGGAGMTERAIVSNTLRAHDLPETETTIEAFYRALGQAADALQHRMREVGRRLPGAARAVADLADHGTVQSVVTGNLRSVAVRKLQVFGLGEYLDLEIGAFGDEGALRSQLVRNAVERAGSAHGVRLTGDRVVVIGDTVHDVRGAQDAGTRAVGVATGPDSLDDLVAAGADAVLQDLRDLDALRAAVFVGAPTAG
ncbi:MAG: phosphoglycolate phosphatase [Actinomycetota bacterium]|nr:phosphoglycolate phosphatase [Actinomycetota bacterium]